MMLEQLVKEIRAGGTLEVHALAQRLNTSPQVVEAMLDHLQRSGLLSAYNDCVQGCSGCSLSEGCNAKSSPAVRLWQTRGGS